MGLNIADGQTFLFQGDSITDCDRRKSDFPLGWGYARLLSEKVAANYPALNVNWINRGISGNTVVDLANRWEDDTINVKPDWLSIMVGINDIHHMFRPNDLQVPVELYRETYDSILERTLAAGKCNIILIEPFYMSKDRSGTGVRSKVLEVLPGFIEVVHEMHRKYDTMLIRTQDLFTEQLNYRDPNYFCNEPVHPNQAGHVLISEAIYKALSN